MGHLMRYIGWPFAQEGPGWQTRAALWFLGRYGMTGAQH